MNMPAEHLEEFSENSDTHALTVIEGDNTMFRVFYEHQGTIHKVVVSGDQLHQYMATALGVSRVRRVSSVCPHELP